ncbi:P-loop containing nucleoside triphosphate hydrolase protein [Gaertneriomyces semiglobifer]|nr:P-loop containing nucleoside triphosphate hydrolase protein [Gaertneriomyces semiglobifer]
MPPKKAAEPVSAARFGRVKNNLKMGVVGLPNVGKSSLFNLLTEQAAAAENYPFCTIEPNESRCPVPDERYDYLCNIWNPPSQYPAYLHITDIAGLIKGASEGQGLGNAFLSHIQAVDGIFHVVRAFDNADVVHVDDSVDPVRDLATILEELCKKDLELLEKARTAEEQAVRKSGGKFKLSAIFNDTFDKMKEMLSNNVPIATGEWTNGEVELINEKTRLITTKPVIYLVNLSKNDYIRKKNKWLPKIAQWVKDHGGGSIIPFSVEYEQELWDSRSNPDAEKPVPSALPKIITQGYSSLNLIYFFTAGEKEVRCWCVYNGALAPQAAGCIHTDFERGFIKAEVCAFDDFKALCGGQKSMAAIKAAGKYRQEGKTYVVKDGDIIHFQFNVTAAPKKK